MKQQKHFQDYNNFDTKANNSPKKDKMNDNLNKNTQKKKDKKKKKVKKKKIMRIIILIVKNLRNIKK